MAIKTAGIFILNSKRELLVAHPTYHPSSFWSITKGKIDEGDADAFDAAIRETREECNVDFSEHMLINFTELTPVTFKNKKKTLFPFLVMAEKNSHIDFDSFELKCNSMVELGDLSAQPLLLSIDGREVCCLIRQYRLLQGVDLLLHRTVELLNLPAAGLKHPARLRSPLAAFRVRDRDGLGFQNDTIPILPPLCTPDCVLATRPQYLCRNFDDDSRFDDRSHDTLHYKFPTPYLTTPDPTRPELTKPRPHHKNLPTS